MTTAVARWAVCLACCMGAWPAWAEPSSPERGRTLLLQRQETGCILCHQIPGLPVGGALGPSLHDLAQRSTPAQARARIADARRFNPQTIMPAYLSTQGLHNVAKPYQGRTVLTPTDVDDIVSYLFQPNATAP